MGCFWSKDVTRGEEVGGEKTSLDSVEGSECADVMRGEDDGGEKASLDSVEGSECGGVVVNTDVDRETQEPGVAEMSVGASSSSVSWYHSTRIQRMMEKRGEFSSVVESEIESSKSHWSEMDRAVSETEHSAKANREYMEVLRRRRYVREGGQLVAKQLETIDEYTGSGLFNRRFLDDVVVGEKLAEGGQAEIYAASMPGLDFPLVAKVFKAGSVLEHLEKQWPPALLKFHEDDLGSSNALRINMWGAILLRDERFLDRFAFLMVRRWGDLRKLIDEQMMEHSHNRGPPFPPHVALDLMQRIAFDMIKLHKVEPPILHNDLKAANVLVVSAGQNETFLDRQGTYKVVVADYECSVGVMGTALWRAPEILQQLKDKVPMAKVVVTMECDIYSFGMVCYEIVSGRIPYEDYGFGEGRDLILKGERLELPPNLHPKIEDVIRLCWHHTPSERPSFENIYDNICRIIWSDNEFLYLD